MGKLRNDVAGMFFGRIGVVVLSIGSSVIIARTLGPEGRGILGLALFVPLIVANFCTLGQTSVNTIYAGLYKDKRSSLFLQTLIMTIFGSIVSVVVISSYYFWLPIEKGEFGKLSADLIWLTYLVTPIITLSTMLNTLVRGTGKIISSAMIEVVSKAVFLSVLLTCFFASAISLKSILLLTALSPLVIVVLSLFFLRDYMTLRPSEFSVKFFVKSLRFGSQVCLTTLAGFLIYRIDLAILAYMVSAKDLGLYLIAVALAEKLKLLPSSIAGAFLPRLANELSDRQTQVPMVFRYTTIVSVLSMLAVGLIGIPAIMILFGKAYTGSIVSFLFLLPGVACLGGATVLSSDSLTRNKPKYSVWIGYTMLAGNVVLNLIFIPKIGIAGAAIASSITYAGSAVMWMFCYKYESKVAIKELFPRWNDVRFLLKMSWSMFSSAISIAMIRLGMTREVGISKDKPMI